MHKSRFFLQTLLLLACIFGTLTYFYIFWPLAKLTNLDHVTAAFNFPDIPAAGGGGKVEGAAIGGAAGGTSSFPSDFDMKAELHSISTPPSSARLKQLKNRKQVPGLHFKIFDESIFFFLGPIIDEGLKSLNFSSERIRLKENLKPELDERDSIYIQLWTWGVYFYPPTKYIIYNWEQMRIVNFYNHLDMIAYFRRSYEVWDYSLDNIMYLRSFGINALLIVPAYHESLAPYYTPELNKKRQKQVAFFGTPNARREVILKEVKSAYGDMYRHITQTNLIMEPWVILNIHAGEIEESVLEVHRISQLIAHRVICVSERSNDAFLDTYFTGLVNFFEGNSWKEAVDAVLNMTQEEYEEETQKRLDLFKSRPSFADQLQISDSRIWQKEDEGIIMPEI